MSQHLKTNEWVDKVHQWHRSGKSAKAWCRENQVIYTTFLGWCKRLKSGEEANTSLEIRQKPHFIELADCPKISSGLLLECNGIDIHLSPDFDAFTLRRCLDVLRGAPC